MVTQQGDLSLLDDPVAQERLNSSLPGSLAYVWPNGTPRVVPIGFHWTGSEIFIGTNLDASKMQPLEDGSKVAISIDSVVFPYKVLLIRGSVRLGTSEGFPSEYVAMARRLQGPEASKAWLANLRPIMP